MEMRHKRILYSGTCAVRSAPRSSSTFGCGAKTCWLSDMKPWPAIPCRKPLSWAECASSSEKAPYRSKKQPQHPFSVRCCGHYFIRCYTSRNDSEFLCPHNGRSSLPSAASHNSITPRGTCGFPPSQQTLLHVRPTSVSSSGRPTTKE